MSALLAKVDPGHGVTLAEIHGWPATVDLTRASDAIGISRSWAYQLAAQGEFPCRVLTIGRRYRVVTASLLSLLETGEP